MSTTSSASFPKAEGRSRYSERGKTVDIWGSVVNKHLTELILVPVDDVPCEGPQRLSIGRSMTVGRTPKADLYVLGDRWLSRKHFSIECTATHAVVRDLESGNGTFVNGDRVFCVDVYDGDQITAGKTVFTVRFVYG